MGQPAAGWCCWQEVRAFWGEWRCRKQGGDQENPGTPVGVSGSMGAFGEKGSESSFLSERAREASERGAMRPRVHPPGSLQTLWDPGLMQCACLC